MSFSALTSSLYASVGNPYPDAACTLEVEVLYASAARFFIQVTGSVETAQIGINTTSAWQTVSLQFTSPPVSDVFGMAITLGPFVAAENKEDYLGLVYTRGWRL
jgi:hypothetical protein